MRIAIHSLASRRLLPPVLLAGLILLAGCLSPSGTKTPESAEPPPASTQQVTEPTPSADDPALPKPAWEGEVYTVVGILGEDTLPLYAEPSLSAEPVGQIPPTGVHLRSRSENGRDPEADWIQVQYQDLTGWVERDHLAIQKGSLPPELIALGQSALTALREGDYSQLENLIHPELCLRFSPYPNLRETDQVLCPAELAAYQDDAGTALFWGLADGTGEPIELSFPEYHQRFVYDQDYFQPAVVGFDREVSSGNAINNIPDLYPDGIMVEYYFPGFDPQYGGLDWRSLRLVLINRGGQWYLAALGHGEWTI